MNELKKLAAVFALITMVTSTSVVYAGSMIAVDGSSTVYPITEAVAEEFGAAGNDAQVTVGISGTGGGFKRFCRGETDISDASRPIKNKEVDMCFDNGIDYIELPVAYDGLAVVINKENNWASTLTVKELSVMWAPEAQGKVTNWNQIRASFPDAPIKLVGPGTDSGTYDYFTEAINGKSGASRGDYVASEDDNVLVQAVATDKNGLGYFGLAYFEENADKLQLVSVDNGKGGVQPSMETVMDGTYNPLSRPLFIYVSKKAAERPEIQAFIEFYLKHAATLTKEVGYIPLPQEAYDLALQRFQARKTGSVFKKAPIGAKVQDLLAKERN